MNSSSSFAADDAPSESADDFGTVKPFEDEGGKAFPAEMLANEHEREARDAVNSSGFEALAWYAPISFYGKTNWGIYVHEPRFWGYCRYIQRKLGHASLLSVAKDLYHLLDRHEAFHAAVELFALISQDQSNSFGNLFGADLYPEYFLTHYAPTWATPDCLEESLATAAQFRGRFITPAVKNFLRGETSALLDGYRQWDAYAARRQFSAGVFELSAKRVIASTPNGKAHIDHLCASAASGDCAESWWFPGITPNQLDAFGAVPRHAVRKPGCFTKLFAPSLLGSTTLRDFERRVRKLYGAGLSKGHRKHSRQLVFRNNVVVPLPRSKTVPHYIVKEVADAVHKTKQEVLQECGLL